MKLSKNITHTSDFLVAYGKRRTEVNSIIVNLMTDLTGLDYDCHFSQNQNAHNNLSFVLISNTTTNKGVYLQWTETPYRWQMSEMLNHNLGQGSSRLIRVDYNTPTVGMLIHNMKKLPNNYQTRLSNLQKFEL